MGRLDQMQLMQEGRIKINGMVITLLQLMGSFHQQRRRMSLTLPLTLRLVMTTCIHYGENRWVFEHLLRKLETRLGRLIQQPFSISTQIPRILDRKF